MNSSVDVDGWEYKTVNIAEYGGELDDHDVPEGALLRRTPGKNMSFRDIGAVASKSKLSLRLGVTMSTYTSGLVRVLLRFSRILGIAFTKAMGKSEGLSKLVVRIDDMAPALR
ncbi:uncharacterized protein STEHIDRAFT_108448 [Stereum hirsutum FP-91666 SS1]|uniref:uncharacterized protein n=1 Tax=Stereum hirsutum (strain FP-91666) TaxID=721885 RepID=UPI000440F715|nr:uncharacterized protein STEHIDRAFT_108448 [Stereum hirsutum FP-91666 SS1]EIM89786.1 hypothetical protein STEHIDRAFT_108448 [Stereum hirsutum FP-91666 SS1]